MKDKNSLYIQAFINTAQSWKGNKAQDEKECIKRLVFYGIKVVNTSLDAESYSEARTMFDFASSIKDLIGRLTPGEFMNIFPIEKDFKGHKWETKDYFYTRDYINTLEPNKPIENVLEFLWEYTNWEITFFNVEIIGYLSDLRRYDGYLDPMEEFMASQGMETPNTFKNSEGKALYIRHGKPAVVDKPKHLQLVK